MLFALLPRVLPPGTPEHVRWLWALMIVGVHFLPMGVSFGPLFLLLGGACISNAALGLLLPEVPFGLFGFVDGALKVFVGVGSLERGPGAWRRRSDTSAGMLLRPVTPRSRFPRQSLYAVGSPS